MTKYRHIIERLGLKPEHDGERGQLYLLLAVCDNLHSGDTGSGNVARAFVEQLFAIVGTDQPAARKVHLMLNSEIVDVNSGRKPGV